VLPYKGYRVLKVVAPNLVDNILHATPQQKSNGVKSGDLGDQAVSSLLPIHLSAISLSK
jgi:hypothetical protein